MFERNFLDTTLSEHSAMWSMPPLAALATQHVPDRILGRNQVVLKSDIYHQWSQWFSECFADPNRYLSPKFTFTHIFSDVFSEIRRCFTDRTVDEQKDISKSIALYIHKRAESIREVKKRAAFDLSLKSQLIDLAGKKPRCWICGYPFSQGAIENFLDGDLIEVKLPPFLDIFKPSGLVSQDIRIEIDHVNPFSHGGGDYIENIKLACGWCNRNKSNLTSIYEVAGSSIKIGKNSLGLFSLPNKFWVVRLLALIRRCEHPAGCSATSESSELTICPINTNGNLNPANLRITCYEHDPLREVRLQHASVIKKLWSYE